MRCVMLSPLWIKLKVVRDQFLPSVFVAMSQSYLKRSFPVTHIPFEIFPKREMLMNFIVEVQTGAEDDRLIIYDSEMEICFQNKDFEDNFGLAIQIPHPGMGIGEVSYIVWLFDVEVMNEIKFAVAFGMDTHLNRILIDLGIGDHIGKEATGPDAMVFISGDCQTEWGCESIVSLCQVFIKVFRSEWHRGFMDLLSVLQKYGERSHSWIPSFDTSMLSFSF